MSAANGVRRVWVGQNGLLSTPAVSAVVRERVGIDVSCIALMQTSSFFNISKIFRKTAL
jgi:phosphoglucomutase